jgi:hypothetical protein
LGAATVVASGGGGGFSYLWSNNVSSATANSLLSGVYNVTVKDSKACEKTISVTISEDKTLPIADLGADKTLNCNKKQVEIGTFDYTHNTYKWSNASNQPKQIINIAGTYILTVTDTRNGCTNSDEIKVLADFEVPIIPAIANITLNCTTPSQVVSAKINDTNMAYLWLQNNATTSDINVSMGGTYTVTVTNKTNGCTASKSVVVSEDKTIQKVKIQGDSAFCEGKFITLDANTGYAKYLWSNGELLPSITISSAGNYDVTVTASNGCTSTTSKKITLWATPKITIAGKEIFCENSVTSLTATPNDGTFLWSNGDKTNAINVSQAATYTLTVTSNRGCVAVAEKEVKMSLNPIVTANDLRACEGQNALLSAGVIHASSTNYEWTNNSTFKDTMASVLLPNVSLSQAGDYYLKVTNKDGCVGKDTMTLNISPKMSLALSAKVDCNNVAIVSADLKGGTSNFSYNWSNNTTAATVQLTAPNSIKLSVTDTFGCKIESVMLDIKGKEAIVFEHKITPSSGVNGAIELIISPSKSYTYEWSNNATTKRITGLAVGKYCVTVTDAEGCSKSECFEVLKATIATKDNALERNISIYPNPSHDEVNVLIPNELAGAKLALFNTQGQQVEMFFIEKNNLAFTFDVEHLAQGVYFLQINHHGDIIVKRVVVFFN